MAVADGTPLTVTIKEAAKMLGIGESLAYEAARSGQIPTIKIGRRLLVSKAGLERMIAGEKNAG